MTGFVIFNQFIIRPFQKLFFLPLFFLWVHFSAAQETVRFDSVKVNAGHYISFGNQVIFCQRDTVLILADTIDYFQSRHDITSKSDEFYSSLKERLGNKDGKFSEALYKVTFGKDRSPNKEVKDVEKSINYFEPYNNRLIGSISLKKLDIFGADIKDTTLVAKGSKKFLNKLHIKTNDRIIYKNLILKQRSVLKAVEVADNERVLRQLPFIKDARIMINPAQIPSPGVDMVVVTKDVFPLQFEINPVLISDGQFGLSNINLFGTGHELETDLIIDDRGDRGFGHDTYLKIRNVKGSFISTWLNVANSFSKEGAGIIFSRDFFTPNTVYAGGGEISRYTFREMRLSNGQILSPLTKIDSAIEISSTRNTQDFWIGRSFKDFNNLPPFLDLKRLRLITAARINRVKFTDRPDVTETTNETFHHRTRLLASIGLSSRNYYKDV
ncbi:MAG: hypothetical protein O2887_16670 [Bacteroidetes bacterium]|nr:hypothetical protein [Bacteroidota bacterium]MDA1122096.1 hypothetical protein [Bacteroidota bacterium]